MADLERVEYYAQRIHQLHLWIRSVNSIENLTSPYTILMEYDERVFFSKVYSMDPTNMSPRDVVNLDRAYDAMWTILRYLMDDDDSSLWERFLEASR